MKKIKMITICSGIGAPEQASKRLDVEHLYASEINKFANTVREKRFPNVKNLGDMTTLLENEEFLKSDCNLIVAGTPCTDFTIRGSRKGLEGKDGKLTLSFIKILEVKRPKFFIWENVPDVLSVNGGEDFKRIVREFTDIGYGISWRVLDSRFFGSPQKRKRIYVVGTFNEWEGSREILFEGEGRDEDFRKTRSVKSKPSDINKFPKAFRYSSSGRGKGVVEHRASEIDRSGVLTTGKGCNTFGSVQLVCESENKPPRIFTPEECESIQGFPKGFTKVNGIGDDQRYALIGLSMDVRVMEFLIKRVRNYFLK